jgi:hypothetical protein
MNKFAKKNSYPTFKRIDIIGIFDEDLLRAKLTNLADNLHSMVYQAKFDRRWAGSWQVNIHPNLFTSKTQKSEDVFPRREWNVHGTLGLFLKDDDKENFDIMIESYFDGIHISFGNRRSRDGHALGAEVQKAVWGDVNQNKAWTKDIHDVPNLIEDVLTGLKKYYEGEK